MAPDLASLSQAISVVNAPMYFLLAWALYRRGMSRSYLFFTVYLVLEGLAAAAMLYAGNDIRLQRTIYKLAQPPISLLYVGMVIEVFQKLFARFPGIARFAKRAVVVSIVIAFVFSLASIGGDLSQGWTGHSLISRYSVILRAISSAIILYLILISLFLLWMPIPLSANVFRHSVLFFVYFFVTSGIHYLLNTDRTYDVKLANFILNSLTLLALGSWYVLLQPQGELVPTSTGPLTSSSQMLNRLESINRSLSRHKD